MSETLLPCPFCGGKASLRKDEHYPDYKIVRCNGCGVYHFGSHLANRWNRRTPGPATAKMLNAVKRHLALMKKASKQTQHDYAEQMQTEESFIAEWEPRGDS
jgi:hypothetical protein